MLINLENIRKYFNFCKSIIFVTLLNVFNMTLKIKKIIYRKYNKKKIKEKNRKVKFSKKIIFGHLQLC